MTRDREKWKLRKIQITLLSELGGLVSVAIPTYASMKTGFHADVSSLETGYHASIGRNGMQTEIIFQNPPGETFISTDQAVGTWCLSLFREGPKGALHLSWALAVILNY